MAASSMSLPKGAPAGSMKPGGSMFNDDGPYDVVLDTIRATIFSVHPISATPIARFIFNHATKDKLFKVCCDRSITISDRKDFSSSDSRAQKAAAQRLDQLIELAKQDHAVWLGNTGLQDITVTMRAWNGYSGWFRDDMKAIKSAGGQVYHWLPYTEKTKTRTLAAVLPADAVDTIYHPKRRLDEKIEIETNVKPVLPEKGKNTSTEELIKSLSKIDLTDDERVITTKVDDEYANNADDECAITTDSSPSPASRSPSASSDSADGVSVVLGKYERGSLATLLRNDDNTLTQRDMRRRARQEPWQRPVQEQSEQGGPSASTSPDTLQPLLKSRLRRALTTPDPQVTTEEEQETIIESAMDKSGSL